MNFSQKTIDLIHAYHAKGMSQTAIAKKMRGTDGYRWQQSYVSLVLRKHTPTGATSDSPFTVTQKVSAEPAKPSALSILREINNSNLRAEIKQELFSTYLA